MKAQSGHRPSLIFASPESHVQPKCKQCPLLALSGHGAGDTSSLRCLLLAQGDVRRGTALALLLAAITHGLIGLILIVAGATEREHRKW